MSFSLRPRRCRYVDVRDSSPERLSLPPEEEAAFSGFDLIYRSLCALLFNYAPLSGHPGGSISIGPLAARLWFGTLDFDFMAPDREDADILVLAAGHKALGLYSQLALMHEIVRLGRPEILSPKPEDNVRLEDLLGFRRNPLHETPLFNAFECRALDGHPTPATPFVRLATGASGVGLTSGLGLALALKDYFGADAPRVHIVEGEGGLTTGRASEALAIAATAGLSNAVIHLDWNQSSIDSDRVCGEGDRPGEYVSWDPKELFHLHDWNVVFVPDGADPGQVACGQRLALEFENGQPTALVYRTEKGHRYGITGRAAHGAGHPLCSDGFCEALAPLVRWAEVDLPRCESQLRRCREGADRVVLEECFWNSLGLVRKVLTEQVELVNHLAERLVESRERLNRRGRRPRAGAPHLDPLYAAADALADELPVGLRLIPGTKTTLRQELGKTLQHLNGVSGGALLIGAADLLGSTSINLAAAGFPAGFYHARDNAGARLISGGGICEDALVGLMTGISSFGHHIGVASSYGAFIAPLGHIALRLHAIGAFAHRERTQLPPVPVVLVAAHAGLKTGEDGPTHADPQALQLISENFPRGAVITLTPWDPQEISLLFAAALRVRPAAIVPFVTRPVETVPDRQALGFPGPEAAVTGLYWLNRADRGGAGTVVLQESGVALEFIRHVWPRLRAEGIDVNVAYVASAELFDQLDEARREELFPEVLGWEAIGFTGFTLPTMYRWVRSERGRRATLHPFRDGGFLGSGSAEAVLAQAGLDGESQYRAVIQYLGTRGRR